MITPLHRLYQSLVARALPTASSAQETVNPVDALKATLAGGDPGSGNSLGLEGPSPVSRSFADVLGRSLSGVDSVAPFGGTAAAPRAGSIAPPQAASFPEMAKSTLLKVDEQTKTAAQAVTQVILGKTENLAQVMLAQKEANLSLTYLIELTNHLKTGFKELLKMEA